MLITILTSGTRGDTEPYLALGQALQKAGQSVRLAAFENYADFVTQHGLDFYPIRGDVTQAAVSDLVQGARQADNPLRILLSFGKLKKLVDALQQDFFAACLGADAVVYHPGAAVGYFAAQHLRVPAILATPFPMTPTREYPALIFYHVLRPGKAGNYLTHKLFEQVMWSTSSATVKRFWKQKFGAAPRAFGNPFSRQGAPGQPTIISGSRFVFPRPADWPADVHLRGYWFLEERAGWQPPAGLQHFLESGLPPVYVGFGSISDPTTAAETTQLVLDALHRAGQRAVLATGWNGLARVEPPNDDIYVLESVPHAWLFPRAAAVVHHGGAGTTAAGVRAGVPAVVIPHSNDQFAWGQRIFELGVGPKPVPRKKLTAEKLADAILLALRPETRAAARALGEKIRGENGADEAAQVIIRCAAKR